MRVRRRLRRRRLRLPHRRHPRPRGIPAARRSRDISGPFAPLRVPGLPAALQAGEDRGPRFPMAPLAADVLEGLGHRGLQPPRGVPKRLPGLGEVREEPASLGPTHGVPSGQQPEGPDRVLRATHLREGLGPVREILAM